jgi:phosphoglycerate transport regulatory protein PgtC
VPPGYPNAFEIAKRAKVQFNSDLSETATTGVVSLFDQTITFRLKELQAATKAIHDAERAGEAKPNAKAADAAEAGAQPAAFAPVVDQAKVADKEFLAAVRARTRRTPRSKQLTALEDLWNSSARQLRQAPELASRPGLK